VSKYFEQAANFDAFTCIIIVKTAGEHLTTHAQHKHKMIYFCIMYTSCSLLSASSQLPSQLYGITAFRVIPKYTAWWQKHLDVNNLPGVIT